MAAELTLIRCDNCQARIVLQNAILHHTRRPNNRDATGNGILHEGACPKCGLTFEVWYLHRLESTHIGDAEIDRPELFIGGARERVDNAAHERAEKARQAEIRERERQERKRKEQEERELAKAKAEEERRLHEEAKRAERSKPVDDGDWDDDYDGNSGGPSQADLDNHANQMNPNNDAYYSSRR